MDWGCSSSEGEFSIHDGLCGLLCQQKNENDVSFNKFIIEVAFNELF
jgi:hypothetical protein